MSCVQDVIKAAAGLGWTGLQLSELDAEGETAGAALSSAAKAGTAGRGGAPEADEALLLAQLREQLTQRLRLQQAQPPPEIVACLKVQLPRSSRPAITDSCSVAKLRHLESQCWSLLCG
jgi:hypothetical protein